MERKTKKAGTSRAGSAGLKQRNTSASSNGKSYRATAQSDGQSSRSQSKFSEQGKFETLFVDTLKDIYWAEKHLVKALDKMAKEATSEELVQAFEDHKMVTEDQVSRLEEVFDLLGERAQAKKCEAMEGLTKEAEEIIDETEDDTFTRDAGLIMAAQKVEHYEIATYGSLVQLAKTLGEDEIADILQETLDEEKEADDLLTQIAEGMINERATQE